MRKFIYSGIGALLGLLLIIELSAQTYKIHPGIKAVEEIPLHQVRLLPGSPFKTAQDNDAAYLLSIDPYRLLHRFYLNAKLPTRGEVYGGWESMGLSGHTLGHYLSACAQMYASTGNMEFKNRVTLIVDELAKCQQARGSGYIGAIPNEDSIFAQVARGEIQSGGFDLNGGWSPWYTVHKVMAGLVDAVIYTENNKALELVKAMSDWTATVVNPLSDSLRQKMLRCEWGGMNDVLATVYKLTGNRKYLDLSYKFFDDFVMKPLSERIDPMPGKHSNTNVPKAIGSANQYEINRNPREKTIASFFWETMVKHHTYVIGGNSSYEYCGEADKLNDRLSDNTCETCNTYNMLKLTTHLFSWAPNSEYMDYYERALYNHILASQNPENGMMCYFVPLRMGTKKVFSDSFNTFTCCVGTGMENHAKYGEAIYYQDSWDSEDLKDGIDGLYVNLFIASTLEWKEGIKIRQETNFPESGRVLFQIRTKQPGTFSLRLRKPAWAKQSPTLKVNGLTIDSYRLENGYIVINREWKDNDQVELNFRFDLYTESMPDNKDRVAFLYGPLVLAGQLGDSLPDPVYGVPVLLTDDREVKNWIKPTGKNPLEFTVQQVAQPFSPVLRPFYQTYKQHYTVYWDFFTPADWEKKRSVYEEEKRRQQEIEANTIDYFRIGEMQPERDHQLQATERSYISDALGVNGREARADHHFSFVMKVDPEQSNSLLMVYLGDDKNRKFDVLIDGQPLVTVDWKGGEANKFYPVAYPIPAGLIAGKTNITVKVIATHGTTTARIFGVRTIKNN